MDNKVENVNENLEQSEYVYPKFQAKYLFSNDTIGLLCYSLVQSGLPFVFSSKILNNTFENLKDLVLRISFEFDFIDDCEIHIDEIVSGQYAEIHPKFNVHSKELFELSEMIDDKMTFSLEKDGEVLLKEERNFPILPISHWSGQAIYPQSIASFVMPNLPMITSLLSRASQILKKKTGDPSFTGYLSDDKNIVRAQLSAIYAAVYEQNISYVSIPASFFEHGQRIRTPEEVLKYKQGNCVEMSILFASLCVAASINPFIVLVEGHAYVGAWLKEAVFDENLVRDYAEISKKLVDGINDLELIEATYMNAGMNKTFEQAVRRAHSEFQDQETFNAVVDIHRSHMTGIRPLPLKVVENGEIKIVDYSLAENAQEKAGLAKSINEYFIDTNQAVNVSKSDIWMRNLLDLSKRNNLISFNPNKKSIQLFIDNLDTLEDAFSKGESFEIREIVSDLIINRAAVKFVDVEGEAEFIGKIAQAEFKSLRLRTFLEKDELDSRLKLIYREAKSAMEENGANTLYLALGFLKWIDPKDVLDADGNPMIRIAPLILLPVDLIRKARGNYKISLRDEDAQLNITLLEMLRRDFDLNIGGLNPLPMDEYGVDIRLVFNSIRKSIMGMKGWDLVEIAFLGLFSFSQFVMWNDLKNRMDILLDSKIVRGFIDGYYKYDSEDFFEKTIDEEVDLEKLVIPSSVDSSQLSAVLEAVKGKSFILHGPPGTGKSQTITNIIANALYQGKSVLFVAEKMAALNVVKERLDAIGLQNYYLELHSNKTQKRVVLEKLERNMQLGKEANLPEFSYLAKKLQKQKDTLNSQVRNLHKINKSGYSIYDLISIDSQNLGIGKLFKFDKAQLEAVDRDTIDSYKSAVGQIARTISYLSYDYDKHPLKLWKKDSYVIGCEDRLRKNINEIIEVAFALDLSLTELNLQDSIFNFENMTGFIKPIFQVVKERNFSMNLTKEAFEQLADYDISILLEESLNKFRELQDLEKDILSRYDQKIFQFDWTKAKGEFLEAGRSFVFKKSKQNKALQNLNILTLNGFTVGIENAETEFDKIAFVQNQKSACASNLENLKKRLGIGELLGSSDIDAVEDLTELCKVVLTCIDPTQMDLAYTIFDYISKNKKTCFKNLTDSLYNLDRMEELISDFETISGYRLSKDFNESKDLKNFIDLVSGFRDNLGEWKTWSAFMGSMSMLDKMGLENIRQTIEGGKQEDFLDSKLAKENYEVELVKAFEVSIIRDLINHYILEEEDLRKFFGSEFANQISKYNEFLGKYTDICRKQIAVKLSQNLPNALSMDVKETMQYAFVNKTIRSKGRGVSIRKLFEDGNKVIKKLTPCFLMSPLSVAQYIDPSFPKFDLLIFDEASQIKTSTAVGAISRAENCIIVGDPNQMPPTSFFSSNKLDEDNLDLEDLESVLDDSLAINMPQKYLDWHYRSKSESLITFSNRMFYKNRMNTFPSPLDGVSKVSFRKVKGIYKRGQGRVNEEEAKAIVREIVLRLKDEKLRNDSIGVVTFNVSQQNLIDDLLFEEFRKDKELDEISSKLKEPVFIKNLESVQGDERDLILFSICFGPDENGKVSSNFGPINKKGGWRRLNVAASRARKEMIIFASMDPEDIKISPTSAEGLRGVREFMSFAKYGKMAIKDSLSGENEDSDDRLIESICKVLDKNGYTYSKYFGNSNFKIDVAVIDPEDNNKYICAIRLDGNRFAWTAAARDRYNLIPSVLEMAGWNIYMVWAIDWYLGFDREAEKLISYLKTLSNLKLQKESNNQDSTNQTDNFYEETQEKPKESFSEALEQEEVLNGFMEKSNLFNELPLKKGEKVFGLAVEDKEKNDFQEGQNYEEIKISCLPYEEYSFQETFPSEDIYSREKDIVSFMEAIVEKEAPISEDLLYNRISQIFSNARLTKKLLDFLKNCLFKCRFKKTLQGQVTFLWRRGQNPKDYYIARFHQNSKRELIYICDYEISNVIYIKARENSSKEGYLEISENELFKEVSKYFGYARFTANMEELLKSSMKNAVKRGYLKRKSKEIIVL
ncbi:DUF4011 domain-containing protein [Peptoniphilaceae bacterium SGI.131]